MEAASGRELRIMFPMVSEVAEFDKARALVDREWAPPRARRHSSEGLACRRHA